LSKCEKVSKSDIVDAVYVQTGLDRIDIRTVFEIIFSEIKGALVDGKTIELRGVGTFEVRLRKGRKLARNPKTGEMVPAHTHRVVCFRPGRELKLSVWSVRDDKFSKDNLPET
jgi:integration host factor subunit beta